MPAWWLIGVALAGFPRAMVAPRPVQLASARFDGRWTPGPRAAEGPVTAWMFSDGLPEHVEWRDGGSVVRRVRCDVDGRPVETTTLRGGIPMEVRVHGMIDHPVVVDRWVDAVWNGWTLRLPAAPSSTQPLWMTSPWGELRATHLEGRVDVVSPGFRAELEAGAGGRVIASASAWIDGHFAARFTVDLASPAVDRVAELWAIPVSGGIDVVGFVAPLGSAPGSLDTLAPGRAILALTHREVP